MTCVLTRYASSLAAVLLLAQSKILIFFSGKNLSFSDSLLRTFVVDRLLEPTTSLWPGSGMRALPLTGGGFNAPANITDIIPKMVDVLPVPGGPWSSVNLLCLPHI